METKIILVDTYNDFINYLYSIDCICRSNRSRTTYIPVYMIKKAWNKWIAFSKILGHYTTIFTIWFFYYTVFLIPGLYYSLIADKIGKKYSSKSTYFETDVSDITIKTLDDMKEF